MFGNDRESLRRYFIDTWQKARAGTQLEAMEQLVAGVIAEHPEYHPLLESGPEEVVDHDYTPEDGQTNPFLHMGMHIALREQAGSDRPPGMQALTEQLAAFTGDRHEAEHQLMEPLGAALWHAQRTGMQPDETRYLDGVRQLVQDTTGRPPAA